MAKNEVAVAEKRELATVPDLKWNGWDITITPDGRTVKASKPNPQAGEEGQSENLTVRTTSTDVEAPVTDVALVACMAAMEDEDARTAGEHERATYWNAFHRLYRQAKKVSRGDELTPDELVNREENQKKLAAHNQSRGDDIPNLLTEVVD